MPQDRLVRLVEAERTAELSRYLERISGAVNFVNQSLSLFRTGRIAGRRRWWCPGSADQIAAVGGRLRDSHNTGRDGGTPPHRPMCYLLTRPHWLPAHLWFAANAPVEDPAVEIGSGGLRVVTLEYSPI